jgi:hypothetical protein
MARQFLASNAGFCYSNIERTLKKEVEMGDLLSRIAWLRGAEYNPPSHTKVSINYHPKKQCSTCSQGMYHSTLYDVSWVVKCPLHNLPLTSTCPGCKLPWPRLNEMKDRKCPICSLPNISGINKNLLLPSDDTYYSPIERLTYLIHGAANESHPRLYCMEKGKEYLNMMPRYEKNSNCFPYIRMYENDKINTRFLTSIPIEFTKTSHKITSQRDIIPDHGGRRCKWSEIRGYSSLYNEDELKWMLNMDRYALNVILNWAFQVTGKQHEIKIMSYRFLTNKDFSKLPPLCPLCLATSLWFLKIAVSKYDVIHRIRFNNYPFIEHAGFSVGNAQYEPVAQINDNWYALEERFRRWFYLHRLVIDFREIFNFAIWYKNNISKLRGDYLQLNGKQYLVNTPDTYKYYLVKDDRHILVFYNNSNPLSLIPFDDIHFPNNTCTHFCNHLNRGIWPEAQTHFNPVCCRVTSNEFKDLHKEVEIYLHSMRDYCDGSAPIYIR